MKTAILALLLSAFAIGVLPAAGAGEPQDQEPVAYLHQSAVDVKVRRSGELLWAPAMGLTKLYSHDAVKTGEASSAIIQFYDETTLSLGENSMVIVLEAQSKPQNRTSAVALPSGTIYGQLDRNVDRPLEVTIRTSRGWVKASSVINSGTATRFRTSATESGILKVTHEAGNVSFLSKDRERPLKPHETLTVGGGGAPAADAQYMSQLPVVAEGDVKASSSVSGNTPLPRRRSRRARSLPKPDPMPSPAAVGASFASPLPSPQPSTLAAPKLHSPAPKDGAPL